MLIFTYINSKLPKNILCFSNQKKRTLFFLFMVIVLIKITYRFLKYFKLLRLSGNVNKVNFVLSKLFKTPDYP